VRQINLWPLGVLVFSAIEPHIELSPIRVRPGIAKRGGVALLIGIPGILILVWFHQLWHGLTPPAFQSTHGAPLPPGHSGWQHEGPNFAVPAMVLAVFGVASSFFVLFLWNTVRQMLAQRRLLKIAALGLIGGALTAIIPPTEYTPPPGPRYSGLWNIAAHAPVIHHRSTLMIALAALGGLLLMLWFLALSERDRWIWLATWACFIAAQIANAMAWHKYYEPFCLIMLALAAGRIAKRPGVPKLAALGPPLLAVLLAGVTLANLKTRPSDGWIKLNPHTYEATVR
jgi:hypothetical protein